MPRWALCALPVAVLGGAGRPRPLPAQVLSGRVVDRATKRPLRAIPVRLLRATPTDTAPPSDTTALATTVTASDGVFMLAAPGPGRYRVRIGDAFFAPAITLADPDAFETREYLVAIPKLMPCRPILTGAARDAVVRAGGALCEFHVEKQAATVPRSLAASYPEPLKASGVDGAVTAQFVVDTAGRADMSTWKVLASTNVLFSLAAKDGVRQARFYPAEIGGRKVKQLVEMPFTFTMVRDPAAPVRDRPAPFLPRPRGTGLP